MAATLGYSIAGCPAHSGPYNPENILVDNPTDQTSRWSGPNQDLPQWLLLRLDTLSVVQSITFGKFSNPHPCNMKDFTILVGPSEDTLTKVLGSQLKNDPTPETFELKHVNGAGIMTPSRYVKIIPHNSHGNSFHTSIWYVALRGIKDEVFVEQVRLKYEQYRETSIMRGVLKHLRQRRYFTPYKDILARCGLQVEDPLVTELHHNIVVQGNWAKAEKTLQKMAQTDLFDTYRTSGQCQSVWKQLLGKDANGDIPSRRGGHAMCIDHLNGTIYLFGGWNGKQSLDDFWAYNIKEDKWRVLSYHTSADRDAPAARSCHKMVFDTKTGSIYVLGRLSDADAESLNNSAQGSQAGDNSAVKLGCEFYRYHTRGPEAGKWEFLSRDPQTNHAPPLIFDHQMVIDSDAQILYVYGGRVIDGDWAAAPKYAGLYSFNMRLSKWQYLQISPPTKATFTGVLIPARFGHSMVLDDRTRTLYIFGGRSDNQTNQPDVKRDMYAYDIATKTTKQLFSEFPNVGDTCFTQRAVIDPKLQEIYVLSGLAKDAYHSYIPPNASALFRYHPAPGRWDPILPASSDDSASGPLPQPYPRFANQVVYDPTTQTIFMHGGNGGSSRTIEPDKDESAMDDGEETDTRLDDFWQMSLLRCPPEEVVRRATFQIRRQQFREYCDDISSPKALNFLQTAVASVVNHKDPKETEKFRELLDYLLAPPPTPLSSHPHLKTPSSESDHEDSPPRKRSRPNTPEDTEMTTPPESTIDVPAPKIPPFDTQFVKEVEDPEELTSGMLAISQARFQQRNALFESLMEFVSEDAKQPTEDLLGALDFLTLT